MRLRIKGVWILLMGKKEQRKGFNEGSIMIVLIKCGDTIRGGLIIGKRLLQLFRTDFDRVVELSICNYFVVGIFIFSGLLCSYLIV